MNATETRTPLTVAHVDLSDLRDMTAGERGKNNRMSDAAMYAGLNFRHGQSLSGAWVAASRIGEHHHDVMARSLHEDAGTSVHFFVVRSYLTAIAVAFVYRGVLHIVHNESTYSVTTSKQQGRVRLHLLKGFDGNVTFPGAEAVRWNAVRTHHVLGKALPSTSDLVSVARTIVETGADVDKVLSTISA